METEIKRDICREGIREGGKKKDGEIGTASKYAFSIPDQKK